MQSLNLSSVVINAVVFAVLFPLLTRIFTRKWIGWLETLVAVAIYVAVGALIQISGILHGLHL